MSFLKYRAQTGRISARLLLRLIAIGSVAATSYIVYNFVIIPAIPEHVTFWDWTTSKKTKIFDYAMKIYPGTIISDKNITYGIFCDDTMAHACQMRISSVTTSGNIASMRMKIYNSTTTILTKEWTDFSSLPTAWEVFTVAAGKKYSIWLEITATSGASVGTASAITFEMKIEEL